MTTSESTALAPVALPLLTPKPTFRSTEMVEAFNAYRDLQRALDHAMPEQLIVLDGKTFRKKGYWRAIAVAFNLTVQPTTVEHAERTVVGKLDDGSENYVYAVTYRAISPAGRAATGDGTCAAAEKSRGKLRATEHNVRSHAHTRAFNRAVSNLVGFGEVSAEEVDERHEPPTPNRRGPIAAAVQRAIETLPAPGPGLITAEQRKQLFDLAELARWTRDEFRAWLKTAHHIEQTSTLTQAQYDTIREHLRALAAAAASDGAPTTE